MRGFYLPLCLMFSLACGDATPSSSGTPDAGFPDGPIPCGNASLDSGETCDDGNDSSGDGCSDACTREQGYACPLVGELCIDIVVCGNSRIEGSETCDDGNVLANDGCDADCMLQPGWTCPTAGLMCVAQECGDSLIAGFEECDDGNVSATDGCDENCALEPGFHCPVPGTPCEGTTCGDGLIEGLEGCDDANSVVGDGCDTLCELEPSCADGVCDPVCGDSILQNAEQCDDGNRFHGDGCNAMCAREEGYTCVEEAQDPAGSIQVAITVRDFLRGCESGRRLFASEPGSSPPYAHPDFQCFIGAQTGMVEDQLDADGKPVRIDNALTTSDEDFALWYRSDDEYNRTFASTLALPSISPGVYRFDSTAFFPTTGQGFDTEDCDGAPCEPLIDGRNFYFTSEVHFWFVYDGDEELAFSGDDDVWLFVNNHLVVDIGGVHGRLDGAVDLGNPAVAAAANLVVGGTYEAVVFQAERHTSESQYRLTVSDLERAPSVCASECGDGVLANSEVCDLGNDNGDSDGSPYGGCTEQCVLEPRCGDGVVDGDFGEVCDDGINLGDGADSCAPGCQEFGARCGDGVLQLDAGESCDDGNKDDGDGCSSACGIEID